MGTIAGGDPARPATPRPLSVYYPPNERVYSRADQVTNAIEFLGAVDLVIADAQWALRFDGRIGLEVSWTHARDWKPSVFNGKPVIFEEGWPVRRRLICREVGLLYRLRVLEVRDGAVFMGIGV